MIFGDIGQEVHDFLEPYGIFIFFGLLFIPGVSDWFLAVIGAFRVLIYQGLISLVYLP